VELFSNRLKVFLFIVRKELRVPANEHIMRKNSKEDSTYMTTGNSVCRVIQTGTASAPRREDPLFSHRNIVDTSNSQITRDGTCSTVDRAALLFVDFFHFIAVNSIQWRHRLAPFRCKFPSDGVLDGTCDTDSQPKEEGPESNIMRIRNVQRSSGGGFSVQVHFGFLCPFTRLG
jgi:hypothetical protein